MNIKEFLLEHYSLPFTTGQVRQGVLISITDQSGNIAQGEVAPLPNWSKETLEEALQQIQDRRQQILNVTWATDNCLQEIDKLNLFPSVSFGLESAILSILSPLPEYVVSKSALLMGSVAEILRHAELRYRDGYVSAKLKVSQLSFKEASSVIQQLKNTFRLRIDVNRAWSTFDSLSFFEQFPIDTFDYVEEPFQNPHDLAMFTHPLAVDESFPEVLSLDQLESFPTLKALIYKPTIQGGMTRCLPLSKWAEKRGIELVLSSSFESKVGLAHISSMAYRLSLKAPVGVGTYYYFAST